MEDRRLDQSERAERTTRAMERALSVLARNALVSFACLAAVAWTFYALNASARGRPIELGENVFFFTIFGCYAVIGTLVGRRQPSNAVGWILSWVAVGVAFSFTAEQYARYAVVTAPGSLPAPAWAAWASTWGWMVAIVPLPTLFLLYFPTGRLVSARWRWAVYGSVALTLVGASIQMFRPAHVAPGVDNPVGIEPLAPLADMVDELVFSLLGIAALVSVASLIVRFKRSRGEERQQMKWITYAATLFATALAFEALYEAVTGSEDYPAVLDVLGWAGWLALPVAAGIAILKYRLYDIDLVINRTLVYGSLSALLALIYLAGVAAVQALLPVRDESGIAVAASTLAIAALFRPLRARVQGFIDQRFYRRKYDAAKTVEEFSARLRDEIDLDQLADELLAVVQETMQPARVSLWLRTPASASELRSAG